MRAWITYLKASSATAVAWRSDSFSQRIGQAGRDRIPKLDEPLRPNVVARPHDQNGAAGCPVLHLLERWLVLGVLIGAMAGVGAIVFYEALLGCTHLFLGVLAGYQVPTPAGEGGSAASASLRPAVGVPARRRTSAHSRGGSRVPIRSRGRGARHRCRDLGRPPQPAGHPASGRSSSRSSPQPSPSGRAARGVGRARPGRSAPGSLRSSPASSTSVPPTPASRWRPGSGLGSARSSAPPSGGAVLAAEILYRDDFEVEALLPSFVASTVGYVDLRLGGGVHPSLRLQRELPFHRSVAPVWYAVIGVLGGLHRSVYAKGFYGIAGLSTDSGCPRWVKPAIGGVSGRLHRHWRSPRSWAPDTDGSSRGSGNSCCPCRSGSSSSFLSPASWRPGFPSARADRVASSVRAWSSGIHRRVGVAPVRTDSSVAWAITRRPT